MFRPLRRAAPLGKVVASLGLALYLQGVALLNFGTSYPTPKSVFPGKNDPLNNFLGLGNPFPRNSLFAFFAALIVGGIVWAVYKYTRFGMAARGRSEQWREGCGAPRLLAAAAGRHELGRRLDHRRARRHPRGPDPGPITPVGLTALIVPARG